MLSPDTWKSVLGAVIVIVPGAPVKFEPVILNDLEAEFVNTVTLPKPDTLVEMIVGVVGKLPHIATGDALFLGKGAPVVKSALLLFVSSQPELFLNAAVILLNTPTAAVPSKHIDVP